MERESERSYDTYKKNRRERERANIIQYIRENKEKKKNCYPIYECRFNKGQ
jgi:hypothetical protein